MVRELKYSDLKVSLEDFVAGDITLEQLLPFEDEINELIQLGNKIVAPRAIFRIIDNPTIAKDSVELNEVRFEVGPRVAHQLKNTDSIAVFVCSIGPGVTDAYHEFAGTNEPLKAYYVDMLGSISVEKSIDIFQSQLEAEIKVQRKNITNRYSPGYCGWNVSEQKKLFGLLPENPCGIRLSDSCLMIPSKSVSGFIGIGENVHFTQYQCHICDLEKCIYRKKVIKN